MLKVLNTRVKKSTLLIVAHAMMGLKVTVLDLGSGIQEVTPCYRSHGEGVVIRKGGGYTAAASG